MPSAHIPRLIDLRLTCGLVHVGVAAVKRQEGRSQCRTGIYCSGMPSESKKNLTGLHNSGLRGASSKVSFKMNADGLSGPHTCAVEVEWHLSGV